MLYCLLVTLLFTVVSCDTNEPPTNSNIKLKLEDVSCTEAWINLTSTNLQLPATVTLKQTSPTGNTKSQILTLYTQDSLLYIDSLLPNQSHQYQVSITKQQVSSNELSVTTLDTTSHNFGWQTWTFGEHSSSVLYDVTIINENNIIAVGEIYMNDSLGQPDPNAYNVVRWDGSNWTIGRIAFTGGCHIIYPPIRSIWSFSENDIWFASGGSLVHYDGVEYYNDCRMNSIITPPLNKIWGTSSSNLYVVGNKGTIIRYNGTLWWRMGTVTDADIQDIWGITDTNNDVKFILCAASNIIEPGDHKILRINTSNRIDTLSWFYNRRVNSVWMDTRFQLFACGDGMFTSSESGIWIQQDLTPVYKTRIRGNSKNDLFVVGGVGLLAHYNGASWKEYPEASAALVYTSVDTKNNLIVSVGYTQNLAVITIGVN